MRHLIQTVAREAFFLSCLVGVGLSVAGSRAEECMLVCRIVQGTEPEIVSIRIGLPTEVRSATKS